MPNGDSVQLEAMVGTDKAGYAGLADEVDHHLGRLIGAVILSSIISVGANLATDSGDDVTDALGDAAAQQAAQVGSEIVEPSAEHPADDHGSARLQAQHPGQQGHDPGALSSWLGRGFGPAFLPAWRRRKRCH